MASMATWLQDGVRTHMYRSSDSLLTRTSLILSIFNSSPSISSTVTVESAMDTTSSSSEGQRTRERGERERLSLRIAGDLDSFRFQRTRSQRIPKTLGVILRSSDMTGTRSTGVSGPEVRDCGCGFSSSAGKVKEMQRWWCDAGCLVLNLLCRPSETG